jgi:hypothetical protein
MSKEWITPGFRKLLLICFVTSMCLVFLLSYKRPADFAVSYAFNFIFWFGLSLGCLLLLMINYLSAGKWAFYTRGVLLAGVKTIPLGMIFIIPVFIFLEHIYPWAHMGYFDAEHSDKQKYLNIPFFYIRTACYFLVWMLLWNFFLKGSKRNEVQADTVLLNRLRTMSAPGLVITVLTMTFAAIDWIMSMDPQWYSTMFPVIIIINQILKALCLCILLFAYQIDQVDGTQEFKIRALHQLGNLLLAFVMLWTYISFSQFLIMWAGDLPPEIEWYLNRINPPWNYVTFFLFIAHFILPFFLLLFRSIKKNPSYLRGIALLVLVTKIVEDYWLVKPNFSKQINLIDILMIISIGSLWSWCFLTALSRTLFLYKNDPRFESTTMEPIHGKVI